MEDRFEKSYQSLIVSVNKNVEEAMFPFDNQTQLTKVPFLTSCMVDIR